MNTSSSHIPGGAGYWPSQPLLSPWPAGHAHHGGGGGPVYPASGSPMWPINPSPGGPWGSMTPPAPIPGALGGGGAGWYHPAHNLSTPHTPGHTWSSPSPSNGASGSGSHTTPVTPIKNSQFAGGLSMGAFPGWSTPNMGTGGGPVYPHIPHGPLSAPAAFETPFSPWGLPPASGGAGGPHSAGPYTGYPPGQIPWSTPQPPKRRKSKKSSSRRRRRSSSRHRGDDSGWGFDGFDGGHDDDDDDEGWVNLGAMRRANSHGTPVRRSSSLHRSSSTPGSGYPHHISHYAPFGPPIANPMGVGVGAGGQIPGFLQADIFNEQNLARRPRDWRADYSPKPGIGIGNLLSLNKNKSDVKEFNDNVRRTLHPLLIYQLGSPGISYDMHQEPTPYSIEFPALRRQPNDIDFAQLAVQPTAEFMRLFHPRLPWYIDVYASHPNGITLFNILSTVYRQLHTPIQPRHYYNEELGPGERQELTVAFESRCRGDVNLIVCGILQIDFLGRRTVFEGLVRGPKGMWEMKTGSSLAIFERDIEVVPLPSLDQAVPSVLDSAAEVITAAEDDVAVVAPSPPGFASPETLRSRSPSPRRAASPALISPAPSLLSSPTSLSPTSPLPASSSHPPSPLHVPKKRLSFMSYSDLLSSTPSATQPLASLTTAASSVDPPPHIPSVSGLSVASALSSGHPTSPILLSSHHHPGATNTTTSNASHSPRQNILGIAVGLPLPRSTSTSRAASVHNMPLTSASGVGGEWEREGLGRGLEERLEGLGLNLGCHHPPTTTTQADGHGMLSPLTLPNPVGASSPKEPPLNLAAAEAVKEPL